MAGVFRTGYQAIANAVWSLVAVASRTVTITTNNDKTGYNVTSGSIGTVTGNVDGSVGSVVGSIGGGIVGSLGGNISGSVLGNVNGTVGSVVGAVGGNLNGSVLGNVNGSVGSVAGSIGGNVNGQIGQLIRSWQMVSVAVATTAGTSTAAISAVTLAKSILIPMAVGGGFGANPNVMLLNWDFQSITRIQVETNSATPGLPPQTAKALVVEFY